MNNENIEQAYPKPWCPKCYSTLVEEKEGYYECQCKDADGKTCNQRWKEVPYLYVRDLY